MIFTTNGKEIHVGAQSYCYRENGTQAGMLDNVLESGLDTVEVCACHIDVHNKSSVDSFLSLCSEKGIKVSTMGVDGYSSRNYEDAKLRYEFASRAGLSYLAADVDGTKETADMIDSLYEQYGVKLMLHNHGRFHRFGSTFAIDDLFSVYSSNLGLHLDTGWALDSGLDPAKTAERYIDRLYGVHLKDFVFNRAGRPEEAVFGEGNIDAAALVSVLRKAKNLSVISVEYEGGDPVENVKLCAENFAKACI